VPLNLYREHTGTCSQKRRVRLHNRKAEEAPRFGWKRCDCPIYVSGTLRDGFRRKKTGCTTWPEAESRVQAWEAAGAWAASSLRATPKAEPAQRNPNSALLKTIEDALSDFIELHEDTIKKATLRKYKTFTKQFQAFCHGRGYVMTAQLTEEDGRPFYRSWKDGPKAAGKKLGHFRQLVRFWLKKKWITNDLGVSDIKSPLGANEAADRLPFTDDELALLFRACDQLEPIVWQNSFSKNSWDGQDTKDFVLLSIYTGLRISDVATFDVAKRLFGNNIFVRAKKNNMELFTWVPDLIRDRLKDREQRFGTKIFKTGYSERLETVTDNWRRKLDRIFTLAITLSKQEQLNLTETEKFSLAKKRDKPFEQKPTPHRFRYTFVRILLQNGVSARDVAELVGDTEEVITKHYAKWVVERQDRLTKILMDAFGGKPKLVPIKKSIA
jgi:integrase